MRVRPLCPHNKSATVGYQGNIGFFSHCNKKHPRNHDFIRESARFAATIAHLQKRNAIHILLRPLSATALSRRYSARLTTMLPTPPSVNFCNRWMPIMLLMEFFYKIYCFIPSATTSNLVLFLFFFNYEPISTVAKLKWVLFFIF